MWHFVTVALACEHGAHAREAVLEPQFLCLGLCDRPTRLPRSCSTLPPLSSILLSLTMGPFLQDGPPWINPPQNPFTQGVGFD